jgi:hypothetical protein
LGIELFISAHGKATYRIKDYVEWRNSSRFGVLCDYLIQAFGKG